MDYPKSVPGVGLVDGKFADEDPNAGRPGSLIPAAWGNAVTDEVINALKAANIEPDETQHDQLVAAIRALAKAVGLETYVARTGDQMTGDLCFRIDAAGDAVGVCYLRYDETTAFWTHATPAYYAVARHDAAGEWIANSLSIDKDGDMTLEKRPTWGGQTPWDTANLDPTTKLDVDARAASSAKLLVGGVDTTFNWHGLEGQPQWLWGGNEPGDMYVYNPAAFRVSYADSCEYANRAGSVGGVGNPASAGAQCQRAGATQSFGVVSGNVMLPHPWVVVGLTGPGNGTANAITVYGDWLRNQ
ncbi:hypothetical protein KDW36_23105 [Burkholderia dolosa]|uniref:hypothetical protein n=1 Tax=Burkholderia dolosa TaxID=152500 RepID=UPI001BA28D14|nr:hypothetical protein [Burkholderia dolosa]MBR8316072.1 hypothetical protein [Burkholderia dolosa]